MSSLILPTSFNRDTFKYTFGDYNPILDTDTYKHSFWLQYPQGTTRIFSYLESRGGLYDKVVFFGLQYYLKEFLSRPITQADIDEAAEFLAMHRSPFNKEGWEYILKEHGGFLPLEIRAVPEGLVVPTSNFLVSVRNTDDKCYWLSSHVETGMLRTCWYGTTVATNSYHEHDLITKYFDETASDESMASIRFRMHDFGARGVSSFESAGIGGMAHLISFFSTDTGTACLQARKYYYETMAGFSGPAAEHSTITSWGRERELDAYQNMFIKFGLENAYVPIVADSYNIFKACKELFGEKMKWQILESGAILMVRPDSGIPHEIVLKVVEILAEAFGSTANSKGYRVLHPQVRVIQGDGINMTSLETILETLKLNLWSAENVFFGQGGAKLQGVHRDDQKFALKCSEATINDEIVAVVKDPITDPGKRSKTGELSLFTNKETGEYLTTTIQAVNRDVYDDVARTVYRNGDILVDMKFAEVRANAGNM